jgi:hypothetical protein
VRRTRALPPAAAGCPKIGRPYPGERAFPVAIAWRGYWEDSARRRSRYLPHESNLGQAQALGFKETGAGTLGSLAMIAFEQGRVEDAVALGKQNLLACRDLGCLQGIAQSLCRSAGTFAVPEAWVARMNEQTVSAIRARLDEGAFGEAWEQGRALTIDEAVALALDALD